jgi:transcriptional regulator with XRE-family HTH domain
MDMAFNYNKLRGRIVERFGTQSAFAKALGVSERTLSLKLNGKIYFAQDEIVLAAELLKISEPDIQIYFFTQEVQRC